MIHKTNQYDLSGEFGIGWTSNTDREFYFDLEDFDLIKDYCWSEKISDDGYHILQAWSHTSKQVIRMHWLLGYKKYDHKNLNPLDNRKENLRLATPAENAQNRSKSTRNTSGIIGVSWDNRRQIWVAQLTVEHKHLFLGYFENKTDAIIARLKAEKKHHKDFAPQRHLFEEYGIGDD